MRFLTFALPLFFLLGLGCSGARAPQGPPRGAPPPPEVTLVSVEAKSVPIFFDYVATTEASKIVEVRSRVRGFLQTRDFEEGAVVKEGATLFTIDQRSFKADQQIAVARVEQAEARLKLAEHEVKRLESVKTPGAVAQTDLDKQIWEREDAQASLRLSKAQRDKTDLELGYTTVQAPLTGYIGKAIKEIGSYVDDAQNSLLAEMRQVDPIYVSFRMSERDYLAWRREISSGALVLTDTSEPYVEITLLDGTKYDKRGSLNFESAVVDVKTGTVELRASLPNPDLKLKPGQFVNAHMNGWQRPNTLAIPQRAVSQSPQGPYVYVVGADNKAELRPITPGKWSGQEWIVESGLKAGEQIVVEGIIKVQPGIEVKPVAAIQAPADATAK
ncbi:MAG: efflux RND transporter periplasmic adaptor subunit [Candidatus Hydrogenedentes bacterium]|nr:efflux RND transporter periplasmic adaptor subunit [Candidatus Hydrogenedentota bacterium]